jgi:hypothetical protein
MAPERSKKIFIQLIKNDGEGLMKRNYTYEQLIGRKLNGLTAPDVAGLWDNMEAILDREMPQQKEKKRPAAWWFNANLLVAAGLLVAVGSVYTFYGEWGREQLATRVSTNPAPVASTKESNAGEPLNVETVAGLATAALPVKAKTAVAAAKPEVHNRKSSVMLTAAKAQAAKLETEGSTTANYPAGIPAQSLVMEEGLTTTRVVASANIVSGEAVEMANEEGLGCYHGASYSAGSFQPAASVCKNACCCGSKKENNRLLR